MRDTSRFLLTLSSLVMAALYLEASIIRKQVVLLTTKMTWSHAKLYCQRFHFDLISLEMARRQELGTKLVNLQVQQVWMGEHKDTWNWSPGKSFSLWTARNTTWASAVRTPGNENCSLYDRKTDQLSTSACNKKYPFVCLSDNLVLVKKNKTWEDALQHCEDLEIRCELKHGAPCKFTFNLLTLTPSDYSYARERISGAETHEVWTGLRFLGGHWFWTNGQELEDEGALPHCPSHWKHCGTLSRNDRDNWITKDCSEKRNFICSKTRKKQYQEEEDE